MKTSATNDGTTNTIITHTKIGIAGCTGRVGSLLVRELQSGHWKSLSLAGGTVKPGFLKEADFFVTEHPDELFEISDMVIDFTTPKSTRNYARLAAKHHKAYIVGTTGLEEEDEKALHDAAQTIPVLYAANMSIGINLLLALVEKTAAVLGLEWDIEIAETHHRHKIDSPSGTALALGKEAAKARNVNFENHAVYERSGARIPGTIGFSVQRGGDVAGEHSVTFFGEDERLELKHIASNRTLFAKGALQAAQWLKGRPPGLYTMRDVLEL